MVANLNNAAKPNSFIKLSELEIGCSYRIQLARYADTKYQKKAVILVLETGQSAFLPGRVAAKIGEEEMKNLNSAKILITFKGKILNNGINMVDIEFSVITSMRAEHALEIFEQRLNKLLLNQGISNI